MTPSRRADLDWLRVLAFALLIAYHAGMAWSGWTWHLEAGQGLAPLREVMRFVNRWRMPLIFLVSGGAIMLARGTRSAGAFARDRLRRLGLPLLFGMAVIVPPQVYLERRFRGQTEDGFLAWLPHAFDGGAYPAGNVSWHHLWFLAYVLAMTFALLPVFLWARGTRGQRVLGRAGGVAARGGLQWLAALPLAASILWLAPLSRNVNGLVGDWHGIVYYGVLLLYGAFLYGAPPLLDALTRQRLLSLALGIAAYTVLCVFFFRGEARPAIAAAERPAFALLSAVNTLAWLFAVVGFAHRHLTARPAFLAAATEAVYPFYILHQTVTVIVVYGLLRLGVAPWAGFVLALIGTFAGTAALYFGLVRPFAWVRPLFGLRTAYSNSSRPSSEVKLPSRTMPNFSSDR
jgi:surface polysaccharide O-acyltransferase-like enzyme